MSLLSIFKRKPGGTMVGNLFRKAAGMATQGILGNGNMMISQTDSDKRDLSDADFEQKYNAKKSDVKSDGSVMKYLQEAAGAALAGLQGYNAATGGKPSDGNPNTGAKASVLGTLKKYWYLVLIPGGLVIGLLIWAFKRKPNHRKW